MQKFSLPLFFKLIQKPSWVSYTIITILLTLLFDFKFLLSDNMGIFDWSKDAYFFSFLEKSIKEYHALPISFIVFPDAISWFPTLQTTSSFFANPEVFFFNPISIFLLWIPAAVFIKMNFAFHLVIAALGIYQLGKIFKFDQISTLFLYILIILNPWMMQHMAVGYTPWMTFYYIPLIIYFLLGEFRVYKLVIASIFAGLIIYEGGLHVFNWLMMGIMVVEFFYAVFKKDMRRLFQFMLFILLTLIIILPRVISYRESFGEYTASFSTSYRSLGDLGGLVTDLESPLYELPRSYNIYGTALYDGSLAMGRYFFVILGLFFVLGCTVLIRKDAQSKKTVLILISSIIFLIILGWQGVWSALGHYLPLLLSEKYPYRFLFIALMLFFFALIFIINRFTGWKKMLFLTLLLPLTFTLYIRNNYFHQIAVSSSNPYENISLTEYFNQSIYYLIDHERFYPKSITPNQIVFNTIHSGKILLPWLSKKKDFNFKSATLKEIQETSDGVIILFTGYENQFMMIPKNYDLKLFSFLSLILSIAVIFLLRKYSKKLINFF